jgi:putative ATPase
VKKRVSDDLGFFEESRAAPEPLLRSAPLADRMRPRTLDEVVGQPHLVGPSGILRRAIEKRELISFILWGPPGSGKTTLARIYAAATGARFIEFSAVLSGVKEIREAVEEARVALKAGRRTVLFIDEIHRFNRAQQDAFLPHVERGTILLVGATTENPSFALNASLLSRARVFTVAPLGEEDLIALLERALADRDRGLGAHGLTATPDALAAAARAAEGDARVALSLLDLAVRTRLTSRAGEGETGEQGSGDVTARDRENSPRNAAARAAEPASGDAASGNVAPTISVEEIAAATQSKSLLYDRSGDEHYNLASALHKSLRSSDPDAALYWLERMLASGEDPHFIARRLVRFASEDVGNADPQALVVALAAWESYERLGTPEGELALAQAALYLALAPRSNAVYEASGAARRRIAEGPNPPVPLHIRNAPTGLMKGLGYGAGYAYAHEAPDEALRQHNLPEGLTGARFYEPKPEGYEKTLKERLDRIRKLRNGEA